MTEIDRMCMAEYGVPATCEGARQFALDTRGPRKPPIRSAGEYASVVRRVAQRTGVADRIASDGRLLAVGYRHLSPRDFLAIHEEWIAYWERAAPRPAVVGSSYNTSPERVWACFRAGVPAGVCRSTEGLRYLRRAPTPKDARGALLRRHVRIGRAMQRYADRPLGVLSTALLEALGRLCPELHRVAVATLPEGYRTLRVRDVDWSIVSREQRRMLERPGYRALWARGKRAQRLARTDRLPILYEEEIADLRRLGAPNLEVAAPPWCRGSPREYKVLTSDGRSCHGGTAQWSLPTITEFGEQIPGAWMPWRRVEACTSGWHLTTDPVAWASGSNTVYRAQGGGSLDSINDKTAYSTARLLRRVPRPDLQFDADYWAWRAQDIWASDDRGAWTTSPHEAAE